MSDASDAVAITTSLVPELTAADHQGIHDVFDAVYIDADHDYLTAQLERLGRVAVATIDSQIVAFVVSGRFELDLPHLGKTTVDLHGLACTHPTARRRRIMQTLTFSLLQPGNRLAATRLSTPATLKGAVANLPVMAWPTVAEPFALYRGATATQRTVARVVAEAHGARDFDDRNFVCIGRGSPIGEPRLEVDAEPEYWKLFDAVNRARGDTLLWLDWVLDPPQEWFA